MTNRQQPCAQRVSARQSAQQPGAAPNDACVLLTLPPTVLTTLLGHLDNETTCALAATTSQALCCILEGHPRLRTFTVDPDLQRCVSRLACHSAAAPRGVLRFECRVADSQRTRCMLHTSLPAMVALCTTLQHAHAGAGHSPQRPTLECLPAAALAAVTYLEVPEPRRSRKKTLEQQLMLTLPPGMHALQALDTHNGQLGFPVPECSVASLRSLRVTNTYLRQLPPMAVLTELDISHCLFFEQSSILPEGCCAHLRLLVATASGLRSLPEGMASLYEVHVSDCHMLSENWCASPLYHCASTLLGPVNFIFRVARCQTRSLPPP